MLFCFSAISVAAAHGQRSILHQLLTHPLSHNSKEILSLEEILAEGASQLTNDRRPTRLQVNGFGCRIRKQTRCKPDRIRKQFVVLIVCDNYREGTVTSGIQWNLCSP